MHITLYMHYIRLVIKKKHLHSRIHVAGAMYTIFWPKLLNINKHNPPIFNCCKKQISANIQIFGIYELYWTYSNELKKHVHLSYREINHYN